jgi:hypothetical protein
MANLQAMAAFSCRKMQPKNVKKAPEVADFRVALPKKLPIVLILNCRHICNHGI